MRYFWADPHLGKKPGKDGQPNMFTCLRPFADKLEMSLHMLEEVNSRVKKRGDQLIIVGDLEDDNNPGYWRQQIQCRDVWMVRGNHDASTEKLKSVFGEFKVKDRLQTKACGHLTVCNHHWEPFCDRSHRGSFMLYGHTHDMRESWIDERFPGRRSQDCGVDTAKRLLGRFTCFSEEEIYHRLIKFPGSDPVEWYEQNRGKFNKE